MTNRTGGLRLHSALMLTAAVAACSDGNGGSGPTPPALSAARAQPSGDGQTGAAGQELANPLRIVVTRDGVVEQGAVVTWSATGTGASISPSVDTTDSDGISSSVWHLGTDVGAQSSQALVQGGAEGSPVSFSATATGDAPAGVTIQLLSSGGNRFDPANVTVPAGTKVTWTWVGGFHNVSSTGAATFPSSGDPVSSPHSYSFTFVTPGTYVYFCSVHGSPTDGMRGTVVVQ
jgi:plastocyanin